MIHSIYPCLWFDGKAKEAADFYVSVFSNSKITSENPIVTTFESVGQKFMCLNGGPGFHFNPAISFYTIMDSKEEIDLVWERLSDGGSALMPLDQYPWSTRYGWIQDRFGVSWQLTVDKPEGVSQKFIPALMFTGSNFGNAEKAIAHYTSIFENSALRFASRYGEDQGDQAGKINHAQFSLNGQVFAAMESNMPHAFNFNEAISLVVECDNQEEIDHFWSELSKGGSEGQCGWLKDEFGVSWQIVPAILGKLMNDPQRSQRVVEAFMKMKKFDIETLVKA